MIPVVGLNTDKSIWGEDAADFKYATILPKTLSRFSALCLQTRTLGKPSGNGSKHSWCLGEHDVIFGRPTFLYWLSVLHH